MVAEHAGTRTRARHAAKNADPKRAAGNDRLVFVLRKSRWDQHRDTGRGQAGLRRAGVGSHLPLRQATGRGRGVGSGRSRVFLRIGPQGLSVPPRRRLVDVGPFATLGTNAGNPSGRCISNQAGRRVVDQSISQLIAPSESSMCSAEREPGSGTMIAIENIEDPARFEAMRDEWNELLKSRAWDCMLLTGAWLYAG